MNEAFKEYVTTQGKLADGKIEHVKILGLESKNGRRYKIEAIQKAKEMYNGSPMYINHRSKGAIARNAEERWGRLENAQVEADGLYADVTYLESHPLTPAIKEDIEKGLGFFGVSHDILGKSSKKDGKIIVEEIQQVISCDVVSGPATTKGFFEQEEIVSEETTLNIEEIEMELKEAEPVEPTPAEVAYEDKADEGLVEAIKAILEAELGLEESLKQISDIVTSHYKAFAKEEKAEEMAKETEVEILTKRIEILENKISQGKPHKYFGGVRSEPVRESQTLPTTKEQFSKYFQ